MCVTPRSCQSSREDSRLARRKVINATTVGTWVRRWAFRSGRGIIPFDHYVPGSRVTLKRERGIAGRESMGTMFNDQAAQRPARVWVGV